MHISDGVLSNPVLVTGAVLAATGTAIGLRKLDQERLPLVGLLSATFFVASLIQFPVGATSVHLVLNGICGLMLGWCSFPAIFVALTLQKVLFNMGGLTTLGVNTLNIAGAAVIMGFACRKGIMSQSPMVRKVFEFLCGAGAVLLAGLGVAAALVTTGREFWANAYTELLFHVPVMLIEGILTVFVVEFLLKVRPEMLRLSEGRG